MPVDHSRVDAIAAAVANVYRQAETALIRDLTAHLNTGLDTPGDWQTERLAAIGRVRAAATAIAAKTGALGEAEARAAVAAGYRAGNHDAVRDLAAVHTHAPLPDPVTGPAAVRSANAVQALADATVAEQRHITAAILPQAESAYRRALAGAAARKLAGAQTWREAAQGAWADLNTRGITGITDTHGRRWKLSTYVEVGTRTAVARAALHGQVDVLTAAGVRLASVDDQPGECALCRPYEHRVVALWGPAGKLREPDPRTGELVEVDVIATLDQAIAAGFMHPNCRHTLRGYWPGKSMLIKQGKTADPAGEDARARQRYIERTLRYWRERELAALTDDARRAAAAKVAGWDAEMVRHVEAHKLRRILYREQIGHGIAPAPGAAYRAARTAGVPG